MRTTAGIVLILLGIIEFAVYGIVIFRIPVPTLFFKFGGFGEFGIYVNRLWAPITASLFLLCGMLLLLHRSKRTAPTSRQ